MKKIVVVVLHLGYWITYLLLLAFVILLLELPQLNNGKHVNIPFPFLFCFALLPGAFAFYTFYSILYTRYFAKKKIAGLLVMSLLVSAAAAIIGFVAMIILSLWIKGISLFNDGWSSAISLTIVMAIGAFLNGIIGLVMRGFITSYDDIKLKEDLGRKNYDMELELVKSQINPHFLFNTINNIDVLIGIDPAKASAYLNKLSDIMRFMLYETKTEEIPLSKELTYIEKYIDLQKIRTSNAGYVNYKVEGEAENRMIAPMLFIPFIENAFKHTENKKVENAISILMVIEKEKITFECENKYSTLSQNKSEQGGLGNELIQKRLALLYPGAHSLAITDTENVYKIKLVINNRAD